MDAADRKAGGILFPVDQAGSGSRVIGKRRIPAAHEKQNEHCRHRNRAGTLFRRIYNIFQPVAQSRRRRRETGGKSPFVPGRF